MNQVKSAFVASLRLAVHRSVPRWILIVLLVPVLPMAGAAEPTQAETDTLTPAITLDVPIGGDTPVLSKEVDLGDLVVDERISISLRLNNLSSRDWKLGKVESTCRCAVASLSRHDVPSGDSTTLDVKLTPLSTSGSPYQTSRIHLHDANAGSFAILLTYRLQEWLAFALDHQTYQYVRGDEDAKSIQIAFHSTLSSDYRSLGIQSDPPIELGKIEPFDDEPDKFFVNAILKPSRQAGQSKFLLSISDKSGVRDESQLIVGVVEPVRIVPSVLRFLPDQKRPKRYISKCFLIIAPAKGGTNLSKRSEKHRNSASVVAQIDGKHFATKTIPSANGNFRVELSMSEARFAEINTEPNSNARKVVIDIASHHGSSRVELPMSLLQTSLNSDRAPGNSEYNSANP